MSEAGRKPRRVLLFVANPDSGSESSDDEGTRSYAHTNYQYHPPPLPPAPAPLTTLLPRVPRYQSSHPSSLSSPSSTSSPAADESTPPPSTPGLCAPSLDLLSDGSSTPDPSIFSYPDRTEAPHISTSKTDKILHTLKAPFSRPRPPVASSPRRPTTSPTASTPESYSSHGSNATVSDRVLILVTADSERYVNVDISGATNPAFIRECVFTKLNIFDEEDQSHFSIYRTEIGSFAIGEALRDEKLFDLCRELGDDKGSLKLLPSPPRSSSSLSPGVSTILPPFIPLSASSYAPLQPKRRSRSRNGSVSSASENLPLEVSAGYQADLETPDQDRSTVRPNELPVPGAMSGHGLVNGRAPPRSSSPLPQPSRPNSPLPPARVRTEGPPLMDKYGQIIPPPPPPPPLSPNRATNLTPPGTQLHARVGSDAAAEREHALRSEYRADDTGGTGRNGSRTRMDTSQTRDRRQRGKTPSHQSDLEDCVTPSDSWVMVRPEDSDHPVTPIDARNSPSSTARAAARKQFSPSSRYKPTSPYPGRPLAIPAAPRNAPPAIPATPAGQPVPSKFPVTFTGKGENKPMPTSSATWTRLTTKSMDNLRGTAFGAYPPNLQPGGGRWAPPLPVSRAGGMRDPLLSAGTPTSLGAQTQTRHIRPLPIQGSSHATASLDIGPVGQNQYGTRTPGATLMSPNNDPYPRPQSAFGDTLTSPNQRYQPRQFQSSGFGTALESDYARSPRAPSPSHQFSSSGTLAFRPNRDRSTDIRNGSDPLHSPVSPRSPRHTPRERRPGSSSSSTGANDTAPETSTDGALSEEGRWAAQQFTESEASTLMPDGITFVPSSSGTMTSISTNSSYESDSSNDGGTWIKAPEERPKSILRGPPLKVQIEGSNGVQPVSVPHPTFASGGSTSTLKPFSRPRSPSPPKTASRAAKANVRASTFTAREEDTWAPRPPPEDVYERLEDFFPEHDLDKPVIEASSGGTSPTSTDQTLVPAPPVAVPDKSRVRGKKSIRIVAQERKKYIDRTSRGGDALMNIQRKRSTKLWGSRVEEVDTSNLPESPSSEGPTTFKWVRGELIGRGTYGRVYLALNATTGEMIAVKQVEIPRTASDKNDSRQVTVVQALKLESETLKVLDHPNIVQYLGFEETPANLSIFLEYVPGGSIGSCLLKHGKFDEEVTKSFTSQILAGLEYLHSKGILHRDLKSDNILVEMTGVCKISDFGISKRTDDHNAHTAMQGTVFWMAPEVINTQKKGYNFKIDIWSIGCVVLEMWAGTRPWVGDELVALFQSKLPPPVPEGLVLTPLADDFRRKCFAINPEERPPAAELRKHPYLTLAPGWAFTGFK
ncbi:hypothetical protein B0H10DRAFT_2016874 [Mycena sp. CBHHK59/15]|nr:hypothetical protein B0H10DRAFT_2016874 [Mycena sp. CBHHK59/15]